MTRAMVDASEPPPEFPVLGEVPDFQLIDQSGQAYSSESLHGKVWVASFLFTRCPTVCPALAGNLFDVQHRTRNTYIDAMSAILPGGSSDIVWNLVFQHITGNTYICAMSAILPGGALRLCRNNVCATVGRP